MSIIGVALRGHMKFPEKPSGNKGDPLYQYGIYKVKDVDRYSDIRVNMLETDVEWERYDLIDNDGKIKSMAQNFSDMRITSGMLLIMVSVASFMILMLIFLFWIRNRSKEIGVLMALGISKFKIWCQFLWEATLIGVLGILLSFAVSPALSEVTASYLAEQSQSQAKEEAQADEGKVSTDYVKPELSIQGVEIKITAKMIVADIGAIAGLLVISISVAGITIMRKQPKEILSGMS